jgi:ABC-type multidrug transport system fused ATPase/permease subunit
MLMGVFSSVVQALGASERVFQLLDRQPLQVGPWAQLGLEGWTRQAGRRWPTLTPSHRNPYPTLPASSNPLPSALSIAPRLCVCLQDLNAAGRGARPQGSPAGGELRLRAVWFAYPSRPGSWVLRGLDLHIEPGRKVRGSREFAWLLCNPAGFYFVHSVHANAAGL